MAVVDAESLAALKADLEARIALHETATLDLRTSTADLNAKIEYLATQAKAEKVEFNKLKEEQEKVVKITEEQAKIIKDLRGGLAEARKYADALAEKTQEKGVDDNQGGKDLQHWKMKFDLDAKPDRLKDGGNGFGEWRDKMERYIGSGDERLVKVLRWAEKMKTTISQQELMDKADELDWEFNE